MRYVLSRVRADLGLAVHLSRQTPDGFASTLCGIARTVLVPATETGVSSGPLCGRCARAYDRRDR